ncbi:MAG: MFS transporter [Nitrososphaerales archaeon]
MCSRHQCIGYNANIPNPVCLLLSLQKMTNVNNSSTPESPVTAPRPLSARTETLVTIGILLGLLMGALDQFVVLTALPTILHDFGSPSSGSFVVSAYVIASAASIPIFSKLSDLWSRRNVFLVSLAVFIGGSILSGLSQNIGTLVAFRAIQGFGGGGFFPVGIAMVAMIFPPKIRARVTGLLSGVFAIAVVVGLTMYFAKRATPFVRELSSFIRKFLRFFIRSGIHRDAWNARRCVDILSVHHR